MTGFTYNLDKKSLDIKPTLFRAPSFTSMSSDDSLRSTEQLINTLSKTTLAEPHDDSHDDTIVDENDQYPKHVPDQYKLAKQREDKVVEQVIAEPVVGAHTNILEETNVISSTPVLLPVSSPTMVSTPDISMVSTPNISRKPIKFTVRKVSSETISSPVLPKSQTFGSTYTFQSNQPKDQDKLKLLRRKYDSYTKRVEKINKEIGFLEGLLPPYNVEIDYKTRVKVGNAIEKLKMKQDELEKKKYELGIVLSRLWRGQDENDLWVRNFGH